MRIWLWLVTAALILVAGCPQGKNTSDGDGGNGAAADSGGRTGEGSGALAQVPPAGGDEVIEEHALGGETVTYNGELPPDWPGQVRLYPDATLGETTVTQLPSGPSFSAQLMTSAPPDEVGDFHRRQAEAANAHIAELTVSPTMVDETFFCADYVMMLKAEQIEQGTQITLNVNPPAPPDQHLPSIRQYVNLDKVPEGFPEDLLPRYPGSNVVNGFMDGPNRCSIEMLTTDDLQTSADYYREHFAALGWVESSPIEQDIVRAYTLKKDGGKVILNVSAGGSEGNHISVSYSQD